MQARTPLLDHPVGGFVCRRPAGQRRAGSGLQPVRLADRAVRRRGRQRRADQGGRRSQPQPDHGTAHRPLQEPPAAPLQRNDARLVRRPARRARARRVRPVHDDLADDALVDPHGTLLAPINPVADSDPPSPPPQSSFTVDAGCATGGFAPAFTAGTTSNQAGPATARSCRRSPARTQNRGSPRSRSTSRGPARLRRARAPVRRTAGPGRHVRPGKRDRHDLRAGRAGPDPLAAPGAST